MIMTPPGNTRQEEQAKNQEPSLHPGRVMKKTWSKPTFSILRGQETLSGGAGGNDGGPLFDTLS